MTDTPTTGDCSSRLQDSDLDVLRVRVGVLEGALRDFAEFFQAVSDAEKLDTNAGDSAVSVALWSWAQAYERARAVLAGGEAAGQGEEKT